MDKEYRDLHKQALYLLDLGAEENKRLERRLCLYAGYIDSLMEGDTHQIGDMYGDLRADGFVDEDGFFIYEEEERTPGYKPKQKKVKEDG